MIGVVEQRLDEIEHVTPAAAAPAPEPLGAVPPRAVDAQGRPVVVVEWAEGGPAAAPVGGRTGALKGLAGIFSRRNRCGFYAKKISRLAPNLVMQAFAVRYLS